MKKKKTLFLLLILLQQCLTAQVTTSSIVGRITSKKAPLEFAVIKAVHDDSNVLSGGITNADGWYSIQNLQSGGPYTVEISFIGYKTLIFKDIYLPLGETYALNAELEASVVSLAEATIKATDGRAIEKTGGTIHFNKRQINTLPSFNRSIEDLLSLSPLSGSGNAFAGTDGRYNNIMVDGASFNNGYGLTSKLTPGGDNAQPFSLDAVEALQVSVAPFDVRRSHFTGADINIVTRSGDNTTKGAVYTFLQPKAWNGRRVGQEPVIGANDSHSQILGFRLGGPIIKDKLFYFVSAEYERALQPGNGWRPSTDGTADISKKQSRTTIADLEAVKSFLWQQYGYDAGDYLNLDNLKNDNVKFLAKLNWNINKRHKTMLRYNLVRSGSDQLVNPKSSPTSMFSERNSAAAIAFSNTGYCLVDLIHSITGEWNAVFASNISNKLIVNYSLVQNKRNSPSQLFPFVDIWKDGDQYMSFGYEPFSYGTDLINSTFEVSDNLTLVVGAHTLTFGGAFNYFGYQNNYRQYGLGYYRYNSLDDFMNGNAAALYALTYPFDEQETLFELDFGYGSAYLQDEWRPNENLIVNGGLRFEMPFYLNALHDNPAINALTFKDGYRMDVGTWPKSHLAVSPRMGLKWRHNCENTHMQLSAGTGLFTGFLPFVWMNEQGSLSGTLQNLVVTNGNAVGFAPDYHTLLEQHSELFPMSAAETAPSKFCEVDKDFRMPRIWRSSVAYDITLPLDFAFTVEALFSKDLYAVMQQNINEAEPSGRFNGCDNRASWWTSDSTTHTRLNGKYNAYLITNTDKGYRFSISPKLTKQFAGGLSGMVAYTYNIAKNVTDNFGTSSSSRWKNNVAVNSLNDAELGHSAYAVPHQIVANLTWRIATGKHLATTISLAYRGAAQGRYSFVYANDLNGDGNASDLLFIPSDVSQLRFSATPSMSADDQRLAFWQAVENDSYLSRLKGHYAERNGKVGPWVNRIDLRILQDLISDFGTKHPFTLQLSLDVRNVANLLNSRWGSYKLHGLGNNSFNAIALLKRAGLTENNEPVFQLNASNIEAFKENMRWYDDVSVSSTWHCMIGLRLLF